MTTTEIQLIAEVCRKYVQFIMNTLDHIQCLHRMLSRLDVHGVNGVKLGLFKEHLGQIANDQGMQINCVYLETMLAQVGRSMAMHLKVYDHIYEPIVYFRPNPNRSLRYHLESLWRDCDQLKFINYPAELDSAVCLIYETKFLIEMLLQP